jgi:hypothetical protein
MPADAMRDVALQRVTPRAGKGALGTWRFDVDAPGHSVGISGSRERTSFDGKPKSGGVYMCQHLSITELGQAAKGKAKVRTGLGKADRPGSQGGLWKRGPWWNCEPTPQSKERGWKPSTYRRARHNSIPTVAADKAAIQRVRDPPRQLLDSGA